jgi:hypothetical protein
VQHRVCAGGESGLRHNKLGKLGIGL